MINPKSSKNHEKLKNLTTFWTLFSQISHAGACVAWRRASRGTFTWLLEQILAQSNYRTCWIFGLTSVKILVALSILFGEYLAIYQTDLDDFQKLWGYLMSLEACSLRFATALIYIWVFVKVGRHKWSKKWKFWRKMMFPKSIGNQCEAHGKPSTWLPCGKLVEQNL